MDAYTKFIVLFFKDYSCSSEFMLFRLFCSIGGCETLRPFQKYFYWLKSRRNSTLSLGHSSFQVLEVEILLLSTKGIMGYGVQLVSTHQC